MTLRCIFYLYIPTYCFKEYSLYIICSFDSLPQTEIINLKIPILKIWVQYWHLTVIRITWIEFCSILYGLRTLSLCGVRLLVSPPPGVRLLSPARLLLTIMVSWRQDWHVQWVTRGNGQFVTRAVSDAPDSHIITITRIFRITWHYCNTLVHWFWNDHYQLWILIIK